MNRMKPKLEHVGSALLVVFAAALLFAAGLARATPPPLPEEAPPAPVELRTIRVILPSDDVVEPGMRIGLLHGTRLNGTTNWVDTGLRVEEQRTNAFKVEIADRTTTHFWAGFEIDPDPVNGSTGNPSAAASLRRKPLSEGVLTQIE